MIAPDPLLSLQSAIERGTHLLSSVSPTARLDVTLLLQHVNAMSRADIIAHPQRRLSPAAYAEFEHLLERRRQGTPMAYLIGWREFWSLPLAVTPDTLIPRPETEQLVERALERIPTDKSWRIADLGTGSGAIALAIAHERPRAHVIATDLSEAALNVARSNAERLGITNVDFLLGDWLAPLGDMQLDVIVTNPPYVRTSDPHLLEGDVRFEPRTALLGGNDGLEAIRHLVATVSLNLKAHGWFLCEHGFDQGEGVRKLLSTEGYREISSHKDLAGHERITEALAPAF